MEIKEKLSEVKNFIDGKFERNGQKPMNVESPIDGSIISTIPLSTYADVDKAVKAASAAYKTWSATTMKERAQIFFNYRFLLEKTFKS